jgi:hypothetical protein
MTRSLLMSIALTVLLALASAFFMGPVSAADVNLRIALPGAPAYTFQESPKWVVVPGTGVYAIAGTVRPQFDVFRHGSYTYAYRGGTWYRARTWNGRYVAVQERYLPEQFQTIPAERWRSYPPGWDRREAAHAKNKGKSKG